MPGDKRLISYGSGQRYRKEKIAKTAVAADVHKQPSRNDKNPRQQIAPSEGQPIAPDDAQQSPAPHSDRRARTVGIANATAEDEREEGSEQHHAATDKDGNQPLTAQSEAAHSVDLKLRRGEEQDTQAQANAESDTEPDVSPREEGQEPEDSGEVEEQDSDVAGEGEGQDLDTQGDSESDTDQIEDEKHDTAESQPPPAEEYYIVKQPKYRGKAIVPSVTRNGRHPDKEKIPSWNKLDEVKDFEYGDKTYGRGSCVAIFVAGGKPEHACIHQIRRLEIHGKSWDLCFILMIYKRRDAGKVREQMPWKEDTTHILSNQARIVPFDTITETEGDIYSLPQDRFMCRPGKGQATIEGIDKRAAEWMKDTLQLACKGLATAANGST